MTQLSPAERAHWRDSDSIRALFMRCTASHELLCGQWMPYQLAGLDLLGLEHPLWIVKERAEIVGAGWFDILADRNLRVIIVVDVAYVNYADVLLQKIEAEIIKFKQRGDLQSVFAWIAEEQFEALMPFYERRGWRLYQQWYAHLSHTKPDLEQLNLVLSTAQKSGITISRLQSSTVARMPKTSKKRPPEQWGAYQDGVMIASNCVQTHDVHQRFVWAAPRWLRNGTRESIVADALLAKIILTAHIDLLVSRSPIDAYRTWVAPNYEPKKAFGYVWSAPTMRKFSSPLLRLGGS